VGLYHLAFPDHRRKGAQCQAPAEASGGGERAKEVRRGKRGGRCAAFLTSGVRGFSQKDRVGKCGGRIGRGRTGGRDRTGHGGAVELPGLTKRDREGDGEGSVVDRRPRDPGAA